MSRKPLFAIPTVISAVLVFCIISGCDGKKKDSNVEIDPVFKKLNADQTGITFSNIVEENNQNRNYENFAYVYNGGWSSYGRL